MNIAHPSHNHRCKCFSSTIRIPENRYWSNVFIKGYLLGRQRWCSSIRMDLLPTVDVIWPYNSFYHDLVLVQIEHTGCTFLAAAQNVSWLARVSFIYSFCHHSMLYDGLGFFFALAGKIIVVIYAPMNQTFCSYQYSQRHTKSITQSGRPGPWSRLIFLIILGLTHS